MSETNCDSDEELKPVTPAEAAAALAALSTQRKPEWIRRCIEEINAYLMSENGDQDRVDQPDFYFFPNDVSDEVVREVLQLFEVYGWTSHRAEEDVVSDAGTFFLRTPKTIVAPQSLPLTADGSLQPITVAEFDAAHAARRREQYKRAVEGINAYLTTINRSGEAGYEFPRDSPYAVVQAVLQLFEECGWQADRGYRGFYFYTKPQLPPPPLPAHRLWWQRVKQRVTALTSLRGQ